MCWPSLAGLVPSVVIILRLKESTDATVELHLFYCINFMNRFHVQKMDGDSEP
ncbi:hypothetical protein J546_2092 [Acinetobacter sp. 1461402]|nr:hypothetical protein J546_2092 [Acinetobacter sp. 1461402]